MITRFSSAIGLGAIATFVLLFLMQTLIVLQPGAYSAPIHAQVRTSQEKRGRENPGDSAGGRVAEKGRAFAAPACG